MVQRDNKGCNQKFTMEQVKEIRDLFNNHGHTQIQLAEKYEVSDGTISAIINNKSYIDEEYKRTKRKAPEGNRMYKLTYEIAKKIREEYKENPRTFASIAKDYNCSDTAISNVIKNKSFV